MAIVSIGTQTTTASLLNSGIGVRFIVGDNSRPFNLVNLVTNSKTIFARNNSAVALVVGPAAMDDKYLEKGFLQPINELATELYADIYSNTITPIPYQFWS